MATKVYGVTSHANLMASIPVGKACLNIEFTGGASTVYGTIPAEYSTSNPVIQFAIENSDAFKNGRITLLRTLTDVADVVTDVNVVKEVTKETKPAPVIETKPEVHIEQVKCLTDAQNYLSMNFGIPTSKARTIDLAQKLGRENGVMFEFI